MGKPLRDANRYAELSLSNGDETKGEQYSEWRIRRWFFRRKYQKMAMTYAESYEHRWLVEQYDRGRYEFDTYPWPYCAEEFAPWDYTSGRVVVDQSGFPVKHCTSYCAYKLFETTGEWPPNENYRARKWQEYLERIGFFTTHSLIPQESRRKRYIGILPDYRNGGLVAWYEKTKYKPQNGWVIIASTYIHKKHTILSISTKRTDWIWVEIA